MGNLESGTTGLDNVIDEEVKHEILPENQTLNGNRVLNFLHQNNVKFEDFDSSFNLEVGLKLLEEGQSPVEKIKAKTLSDAKDLLTKEQYSIFLERTARGLELRLNDMQAPPVSMTQENAEIIRKAWKCFSEIRERAKKLINVDHASKLARERQLGAPKSAEGTLEAMVKNKLRYIGEKWDTFSTNEKLTFAAGSLVVGYLLYKALSKAEEGSKMAKMRKALKYAALTVGVSWLINKGVYLNSGKSLLDKTADRVQHDSKNSSFVKDAFETDDKGAEILSSSFVHMGDSSFVDLTESYEKAKKDGTRRIEGTKMNSEEAFLAMEIFFNYHQKRFGSKPEDLLRMYSRYNPPLAYNQVVTLELAKDKKLNLKQDIVSGAGEVVSEWARIAAAELTKLGGEPFKKFKDKCREWSGTDLSDADVQKVAEKFKINISNEGKVNSTIAEQLEVNKEASKKLIEANNAGVIDKATGVKYIEPGDGYVYMVASKQLNNPGGDLKKYGETIFDCIEASKTFLANKFTISKTEAAKKCIPSGSIFVEGSATMKYFVRYKV